MDTITEQGRKRIERTPVAALLVIGLILTLSLTIRIPVGDELVVPGQVKIGSAVVTIGDLYLVCLASGLVMYSRQIWIPRSPTTLALSGFVIAFLLSAIVNGLDRPALLEVIQWAEMVVLGITVGVLLQHEWERQLSLRALVYIGSLRAVWSLGYFLVNGYPGRRFDILIEGTAFVVLLGLIAHEGWTRFDLAQVALLATTILIGQERKVWVGIVGTTVVMGAVYAFRTRNGYAAILTLIKGTIIAAGFAAIGLLFVFPPNVQERIFTMVALFPGIDGQPEFERLYLISTGLEMFLQNPLFGVGPENWFEAKSIYATKNLIAFEEQTGSDLGPHSILIKIAAETGLIGLFFFGLLIVRPLRFLGWYLDRTDSSGFHLPLLGLFLFTLAVASVRAGGFTMRAYLFLSIGFLLSYEMNSLDRSLRG